MINTLLSVFEFNNLLMMNIGVAAGIIIGALPGLSVILAIILLLPMTFGMDSLAGMYLLLGAYCGATYGGSISAILINTPGSPVAAATAMDGYALAKKGRASDALKAALVASCIGGIISCLFLIFTAPVIASFGLKFGPPEFFALCVFGLSIVSGIGKSPLKGIIMAGVGLLISTVGIDSTEGIPRFMFNVTSLMSGINIVPLMLGVYAVSEMVNRGKQLETATTNMQSLGKSTLKFIDILKHWKNILRSSLIGVFIGAVPGTGGSIAAFLSYSEAKRASKNPDNFGKGDIDGIIAPETANNATTGATLIPLLTLGIPGDAAVAVLLGALTMQGLTPGPELFVTQRVWLDAIMFGLIVINIIMLFQGLAFSKLFSNVIKVDFKVLLPCVIILTTTGAYAISNSVFEVTLMLVFGFLGYLFSKCELPVAPMAIALVLGRLTENNLRRSLILSEGEVSIFFTRPIALVFIILAVASLSFNILRPYLINSKTKKPHEQILE